MQAKNRIFNGNSRSARTAPLKILTPAPRIFVLLNSAPKSPKISSAALRKAHPAVCIQHIFPFHPAGTVTDNFKFNKQKQRQNFFGCYLQFIRFLLLKQRKIPAFKQRHKIQFLCQSIKFCLLFLLV